MKDDNTTGSFQLCCLFCVLSVIIIPGYISTSMYLYITTICTEGVAVCMCPCLLMAIICEMSLAGCTSAVVHGYVDIVKI